MATQTETNPYGPIGLSEEQTREYLEFLQFTEDEIATVRAPTLENLGIFVVRHLTAAPFTNIDIQYSQKHEIVIELEHLFDKVIRRKRGGYCMELNTMFNYLLATLGYNVWLAGARVTQDMTGDLTKRRFWGLSHCVNIVEFDNGKTYFVDVGFGGTNPVRPIELTEGAIIEGVSSEKHRLVKAPLPETRRKKLHWLLQYQANPDALWVDQYMFFEDEVLQADFQIWSHWTSTKQWIFVENLLMARVIREGNEPVGRYTLFNEAMKTRLYLNPEETKSFKTEDERVAGLKEYWGVELSEEDREAIKGRNAEIKAS